MTVLLESRLEELIADGDRRDAAELATAALKNDDVVDVSVDGDTVAVETRRFRGVHDVDRDGDPTVVQQGEYEVKGDVSFSFSTATMHDDALAAAREQLAADVDDDAPDAGSDPADAGDVADAATDGGEPERDARGALGRLEAALRNIVG